MLFLIFELLNFGRIWHWILNTIYEFTYIYQLNNLLNAKCLLHKFDVLLFISYGYGLFLRGYQVYHRHYFTDLRTGVCYLDVSKQGIKGTCSNIISHSVSKATCCCSIGRGWGEVYGMCDKCPTNGSSKYWNYKPLLTNIQ